jgi:hypothetical protein
MKKAFAYVALFGLCLFGQKAEAVSTSTPKPVVSQVIGGYCCNGYGARVCVMSVALPVGSGCCCAGVGCGGYVCL